MTHSSRPERALHVDPVGRVEGEAALSVTISDGALQALELRIYEPPRFFEAFLRGRRYTEPPDITARICGICPVAYQMSACAAIESACGVTVPEPLAALRRLLYCGEWIESHALHVYLLHAPDFLGYQSALEMAGDHRDRVQQGLDLKKTGNQLLELIGGRAIHPVNVRVGGFYRVPTRRELQAFRPRLERARDQALDTIEWVAAFDFPEDEGDWELASLRQPGRYPITGGRLVSTGGLDVGPDAYAQLLVEEHLERSTALHGHLSGHGRVLFGPLARFVLNASELAPSAREAAAAAGLDQSTRNPFRSIVVRAVEILQACEEAIAIIDAYDEPDRPAVAVEPRPGAGCGWTEAPRGLLWHRYEIDETGRILDARIAPPTAANQDAIEGDLARFVGSHLELDDETLGRRAEQVIRNHDPCISCATHFLDVQVQRS